MKRIKGRKKEKRNERERKERKIKIKNRVTSKQTRKHQTFKRKKVGRKVRATYR
jgi:hypothetical protein